MRNQPRILLLCVVTYACTEVGSLSAPNAHSADRAVYGAVLDTLRLATGRTAGQLVVVDSALTVEAQDVELDKVPGVDTSAVSDFRKQNSETRSLGYLAATGLRVPIVLVSRQNLDSFLHNGPEAYWAEFYRRYPGSNGSISFSSIGYTADGNTAVLVVDQACGTFCGALSNVVVKYERGRWHVALIQVKVMS